MSWNAPVANADGSPLIDLSGYRLYYRIGDSYYYYRIDVGNVTTYRLTSIADGLSYYFAVTAYDTSGNESIPSKGVIIRPVDYYCDTDNDGFTDRAADGSCTGTGCEPAGCQIIPGNDCNDDNPAVNPEGNDSNCNGIDENCDGTPDNNYTATMTTCGEVSCESAGQLICSNGSTVDTCTLSPECIPETHTIINIGDNWRYVKGYSNPSPEWNTIPFDDSAWLEGPTGIGYGDGDDATILSDMQNNYISVYTRKSFNVTNSSLVADMSLSIDYDDGFVAYLNGQEVARANMPDGIPDYLTMSTGREAGSTVTFDLSSYKNYLVTGMNVLAIEVHNWSIDSSDLSLIPELSITAYPDTSPVDYYCDNDNDGYAGIVIDGACTGAGCEPAGCQITLGNDCSDDNPAIHPDAADDTCDGIDDDCDGAPDNNYVTAVVSCGAGVCSSVGQLECRSGVEVSTCSPDMPAEDTETTCGDGLDNDCDGQVDEGCFPDIKVSKVLLGEDFSNGIPADWSVQGAWSADNQCGRMIGYPFEGPFAITDSSCTTTGVDELVTALFDTVSCSSVELAYSNQYYWYSGNIEVDVSSDGGVTWTHNISVEEDAGYPLPQRKEIDISSVTEAAEAQIKFRYTNDTADGFWALDNVRVACQTNQLQFSSQIQVQSSIETIMITNAGTEDLGIDTIIVTGPNLFYFNIGDNDDCSHQRLLPAQSCTFDVVFLPAAAGYKTGTLSILSNDPDTPIFNIFLGGTGTDENNNP